MTVIPQLCRAKEQHKPSYHTCGLLCHCRNLGLEYLDLYLIHWPVSSKEPGEYAFLIKENLLPMDLKSTWEAMEKCQKLGLAEWIGVSNFSCKKLSDLLSGAKIPPAVNQVSDPFPASSGNAVFLAYEL